MIEKAYAKVNMALEICGKRGDMHLLDMLVAQIDLCDDVDVNFRNDDQIFVQTEGVELQKNSCYKAIRLLQEAYDVCGADVKVKKRIPLMSGLGGSTADGVAVLKAYNKKFGVEITNDILLKLGSDAPCMYKGGLLLVGGVGEVVVEIEKKLKLNLAILVAEGGVSTAEAYKLYDEIKVSDGGGAAASFVLSGDYSFLINDLEAAATKLNPNIAKEKQKLMALGAKAVVMSGSGGAVVGYFDGEIPKNSVKNLIKAKII